MKNAQLICTAPVGQEPAILTIEGELTIRNAAAIREELLVVLHRFENLKVVVRQVTDVDLAFIQLLLSLRQSAAALHTSLSLELDLPDELQVLLNRGGLHELIALL